MRDLFATGPAEHLPCLTATITMAEAGPAELRRRSRAWSERRVTAAVRSPVEAIYERCWPAQAGSGFDPNLMATTSRALADNGATVAIIDLNSLARRGGLLDQLKAAGLTPEGPDWR